jgi:hypothetical protein
MEKPLFESADGPLVSAIGKGNHYLWMKLTWLMMQSQRDSVLFLKTEKRLLLAERWSLAMKFADGSISMSSEFITAAPGFRVFATMNPGGDFGKKELSPAMWNRFTAIWIPVTASRSEYGPIISSCITADAAGITSEYSNLLLRAGDAIVDFVCCSLAKIEASGVGNHSNVTLVPDGSVAFARRNDVGQLDELTTFSDEKYAVTFRDSTVWAIFTRVASVNYGLHPMFLPSLTVPDL